MEEDHITVHDTDHFRKNILNVVEDNEMYVNSLLQASCFDKTLHTAGVANTPIYKKHDPKYNHAIRVSYTRADYHQATRNIFGKAIY